MSILPGERSLVPATQEARSGGRNRLLDLPSARRWFEAIDAARRDEAYTFQRSLDGKTGPHADIGGRTYLMLSSYDYLGLVGDPRIEAAAAKAIATHGTGTGGVRLLTGTCDLHAALERSIAAFKGAEAAITFSSGYAANLAALSALLGPNDLAVADRYVHRSLLDGCRLANVPLRRFRHNDVASLRSALGSPLPLGRTLVIVEGVYSMDGDVCPLPDVVEVARHHGAYVYVDEAHSLGTLGARGRGVQEHFGLPTDAVDVWMGCLSKAVPANGGYIAGSRELVLYLQHAGAPFMFSAALCPPAAAAAHEALQVIQHEPRRRELLKIHAEWLREGLRRLDYDTGTSTTAVIPILLRSRSTTLTLARDLWARGIAVAPVTHPAVPRGASRLRLCATAGLSPEDIDTALDAFRDVRRSPAKASARPVPAADAPLCIDVAEDIDRVPAEDWDSILDKSDLLATHRFVQACQHARFEKGAYRNIVVRRQGRVAATASLFRTTVPLDVLAGPRMQGSIAAVRRVWPRALQLPMIVGGLPVSLGTSCVRVAREEQGDKVLPYVFEAVEIFAQSTGTGLLCLKELSQSEADSLKASSAAGYMRASSLPGCVLRVRWPTWEGYVHALRASYRRQLLQGIRKGRLQGLRIQVSGGLAIDAEHMEKLYAQTWARATHRLERLNAKFFDLLGRAMRDELQTFLVRRGGRILCAGLTLRAGGCMRFLLVGMEYSEAPLCDAYVHLVTEIVAEAIRTGVEKLELGQTAYALKLRLGGRPSPLWIALRHRNALLQRGLRLLVPALFPTWAPSPRRAFRSSALVPLAGPISP